MVECTSRIKWQYNKIQIDIKHATQKVTNGERVTHKLYERSGKCSKRKGQRWNIEKLRDGNQEESISRSISMIIIVGCCSRIIVKVKLRKSIIVK